MDSIVFPIFSPVTVSAQAHGSEGGTDVSFLNILGGLATNEPSAFPVLSVETPTHNPGELEKRATSNLFGLIPGGGDSQISGTSASLIPEVPLDNSDDLMDMKECLVELGISPERMSFLDGKGKRAEEIRSILKAILTEPGTGSGVGFIEGDNRLSLSLDDGRLRAILLDKGVLEGSQGSSVLGDDILKALPARSGTGSGVGFIEGDNRLSLSLDDGRLRAILLDRGVLEGSQGSSVLGDDILKALLARLGTRSGNAVLFEAGSKGGSLEVLEEGSGPYISRDNVLKGLPAKLNVEPESSYVLRGNPGDNDISGKRDNLLKAILTRMGMNPEDARMFSDGQTSGQKGVLGDQTVRDGIEPVRERIDFSSERIAVNKSFDAGSPHGPEGKVPLKTALAEKVLDQLGGRVSASVRNGRNEITIGLKPEFLGRLHIRISIEDQHVMARILTENPVTKEIIEANAHQLKLSLLEHGLKVDKFSVFVGYDQNQFSQGHEDSPFERTWMEYASQGDGMPMSREEEEVIQLRRVTEGEGQIDCFA